jgi:RNA polymerase sigma-70 factor (TIGR02957 family)
VRSSTEQADEFEGQRGRLFALAYRLLGSASEAEDAVQDAFLRWHGADREALASPAAWLTTVVTNLCLNRLNSARARREEYVGIWLPEPVLTGEGALGPLETIEQRESVSFALLVVLERLTPSERAVFVLHEAYGYRYREIADVLGLTDAHCRQLLHRARQRVGRQEARFRPSDADLSRLVERFLQAARDGDVTAIEQLLADDVVAYADSGGMVNAARRPIHGRDRVARYLAGLVTRFAAPLGLEIRIGEVNGAPTLLGWAGHTLATVTLVETGAGGIREIRLLVNPDKLAFASAQGGGLSRSSFASGQEE